jgi:hypothetical protein
MILKHLEKYTPQKEHHPAYDKLPFQTIHESDPAALSVSKADAACHAHFASLACVV